MCGIYVSSHILFHRLLREHNTLSRPAWSLVRIPVSIENLSPKRQGIRCKSDVGSTSKLSTTLLRHPAAGRKRTEPETRSSTHGITTRTRFAQLELALHSTWLVGEEQAQVVDDGRMRAITFSLACQHLRMWARSPLPQVELEAQRERERETKCSLPYNSESIHTAIKCESQRWTPIHPPPLRINCSLCSPCSPLLQTMEEPEDEERMSRIIRLENGTYLNVWRLIGGNPLKIY